MNQTAKQQLKRNVCPLCYATPARTYSVAATTNDDGTLNIPAQPVYGIDPNNEPIDGFMAVRQYAPITAFQRDATANDSDKNWTVPAGQRWEIIGIYVLFVSTATVGNRVIAVAVTDGTDQMAYSQAATVQPAGQTYTYQIAPNFTFSGAGTQTLPILPVVMQPGWVIRVYDAAAVDAAADDMTVVVHYRRTP